MKNIYCIEKYTSVSNAIFPIVKDIYIDEFAKKLKRSYRISIDQLLGIVIIGHV